MTVAFAPPAVEHPAVPASAHPGVEHPAPPVPTGPSLRAVRYEPDPGQAPPPGPAARAGPAPQAARSGPDGQAVRGQAGRVLQLALEAVDGRRPLAQLTPHFAPSALRYLRAACARLPTTSRDGSRVLSLHLDRPGTDAAEVAATCRVGGRTRAVAARFELLGGPASRWRCTVLRIG